MADILVIPVELRSLNIIGLGESRRETVFVFIGSLRFIRHLAVKLLLGQSN